MKDPIEVLGGSNALLVEQLLLIKKSIIQGATDVLWIADSSNTTVCEQLDGMLAELGVDNATLEAHYVDWCKEQNV